MLLKAEAIQLDQEQILDLPLPTGVARTVVKVSSRRTRNELWRLWVRLYVVVTGPGRWTAYPTVVDARRVIIALFSMFVALPGDLTAPFGGASASPWELGWGRVLRGPDTKNDGGGGPFSMLELRCAH